MSDAPNESLTIMNGTAINGRFIPWIEASRTHTDDYVFGITASVPQTSDAGNKPMMHFDSRWSSGPLVNRPLFSWGSYSNSYMIMNAKGDLGIGTNNPQHKLSVKGKIQAEEIKVTTSAADWPDYVFKTDYNLRSLAETERFINEHGHLPDVPKAQEVEADGVSLGEMNKILLKKIEEMTLQLIQLNREVKMQSEQVKKQSEKIKLLEKE